MRKILQKKEKGYYSCLDFDNLYKKKKKKKLRFALRRDKHFSDTEVVAKKSELKKKENGNYYIHKQKHYIKKNDKFYLCNEVEIYKDYFGKCDFRNKKKINSLKKILKIYEHVSTSEKNKLYELIKFVSFTRNGFQNNALRRKLWLLLLGFNTNLSKEENYNEHPIYILCKKEKQRKKRRKESPRICLLKGVKLKWTEQRRKREVVGSDGTTKRNEKRTEKEDEGRKEQRTKKIRKNKDIRKENINSINEKKYRRQGKHNFSFFHRDWSGDNKKQVPFLEDCKNSTDSNNSASVASSFSFSSSSSSFRNVSSASSSTSFLIPKRSDLFSTLSVSSSATSPSGLSISSSYSCRSFSNEKRIESISKNKNTTLYSFQALLSRSPLKELTNYNKQNPKTPTKVQLSGDMFCSNSNKRKIRKEFVYSSDEKKGVKENTNEYENKIFNGYRENCRKSKRIKNEEVYTNIKGKIKRQVQRRGHEIANSLLTLNGKKKQNKNFIIKLLKIIYTNLIEIDIYVVDFILKKFEKEKRKKSKTLSYLKYNAKNNFHMHSNLRRWIMDSILLDDAERVQVKKDVKRSVNTWNVHKNNNIYEIKKKYQYLLKNIICSILYKHSKKIYYAQGVHDVCLVFITLYFHDFFIKYKKYVFLEYFIRKYVIGKICSGVFTDKLLDGIEKEEECFYLSDLVQTFTSKEFLVDAIANKNRSNMCTSDGRKSESEYFSGTVGNVATGKQCIFEGVIYNMFSMEANYVEKLCVLKNINFEKYLEYKKKKKKREYAVYLLCERFLLFYMIDYLTLSLDVSIKNTFKGIGLLLKYIDEEVYDVFCLLHKEQQLEDGRKKETEREKEKERAKRRRRRRRSITEIGEEGRNSNEEEKRKGELSNIGKNIKGNLQLNGNEFFFCLSWVLTYYSHVFTEFDKLARIFDTLLANNGIFIIYFTSTIILNKKKELLELVNTNKNNECIDNLYSETHFIFQNMKWEHINLENIIQKTYYYMNYKYPFEKFLKKIKQVISFPPFSPIYSYPFILHHFNYQRKKEELKEKSLQNSICKFHRHGSAALEQLGSYMSETNKRNGQGDIEHRKKWYNKGKMKKERKTDSSCFFTDDECKRRSIRNILNEKESVQFKKGKEEKEINCYKEKKYLLDQFDERSESFEKYVESILNKKESTVIGTNTFRDLKKKCAIFKIQESDKENSNSNNNNNNNNTYNNNKNIHLHYPYSLLCSNNIDVNNQIVKKHLLVENFFIYVCYDFIVNYECICNKYETKLKEKYYIIQYINVKGNYRRLFEKLKEKKRERMINRLKKHITYLSFQNKLKVVKPKTEFAGNSTYEKQKNKRKLCSNKWKDKIHRKKNIAIIPPIYKYIVENSDMNKNILSYKKITLSHASTNDKHPKQKEQINQYSFFVVTHIFYNYICNNFFLFFFCISLITSLFYLKSW